MQFTLPCLDKGYVRLITWLPWNMAEIIETENVFPREDDLTVVNAARVSFQKKSNKFTEKDKRLIQFLAERGENSPFRHAILSFEIKAPMMVARQWFKYRIGSQHSSDTSEILGIDFGQGDDGGFDDVFYARNESSRRYVTSEPDFYIPSEWRSAPENKKQGSSDPLPQREQDGYTEALKKYIEEGIQLYEGALERGMAAEQARLFLPAYGLYLTWRWTTSLAAVCHFLNQRLAEKAQKEIQEYAQAVWQLAKVAYPESVNVLVKKT